MSPGLDTLWEALGSDLPPDTQRMLLRLIRAHVQFLTELVKAAEQAG